MPHRNCEGLRLCTLLCSGSRARNEVLAQKLAAPQPASRRTMLLRGCDPALCLVVLLCGGHPARYGRPVQELRE